jgi:hypothetical protein
MKTIKKIWVLAIAALQFFQFIYACEEPDLKDTVTVNSTSVSPVFDGKSSDACWQNTLWQAIDQMWIPWGDKLDSADFSGRYKVSWSESENLLFFLVEITDDVVSDAYVPGKTAAIYNFDMFEVFIDEDRSGGYHVFDGKANNESGLGINAENAFAYHIFTEIPDSGLSSTFYAEDLGGENWEHAVNKLYNNHFPDFILRREGKINTWEFSLKVFNDTYSDENCMDSQVTLRKGKIMGLSLAYNDDDQPETDPALTQRDNFIGSAPVTKNAYNDHWKNADDFGIIRLTLIAP